MYNENVKKIKEKINKSSGNDTLPEFVNNKGGHKFNSKEAKKASKKGRKSPHNGKHGKRKITLAKEEVYRIVQERLADRALKLIDTQTVISHGTMKVFKITYHMEGKRRVRNAPELVTKDSEIAAAIGYEYGGGPNPSTDDEYFFITQKDPDNKAIESQLNRVFGKAPQKLDLTPGGKIGIISGMQIIISDSEEDENGDPV